MHDYSQRLGDAVKRARESQGLTQTELAEKISVAPRTILNIEALLASLWVRNAAVPCNQATLGTFDFRLGSGMRISEHNRYTISIMF